MRQESLKIRTRFGSRLALLRKENDLSQSAFAKEYSDYAGRKKKLTVTTVSYWETGGRMPEVNTLIAIARFFDVSLDFLIGTSNSRDGSSTQQIASEVDSESPVALYESIFRIPDKDIRKYDGLPVFVVFPNMEYENQWAILDSSTASLITKNGVIKMGTFIGEYYTFPKPADVYYSFNNLHSYNERNIMKADKFWVEIKSHSGELRKQYAGWWKHNEAKTGIINIANGLTLPYEGLGISYNAYMTPLQQ